MKSSSSSSSSSVPVGVPASRSMSVAQRSLFQLQLWHLRQLKRHERTIREMTATLAHADKYAARQLIRKARTVTIRRAARHQKFIDAITPFVSVPVALSTVGPVQFS